MLGDKDDDNQPLPASQQRVTPEELAHALAALEERRQNAEAAGVAGTVPIGQAIDELALDSTAEEIWQEVQTQRETSTESLGERRLPQKISVQEEPLRAAHSRPSSFSAAGIAGLAAVSLLGSLTLLRGISGGNVAAVRPAPTPAHAIDQYPNSLSRISMVVDDAFYRKLRLCQGPSPVYHLMYVNPLMDENRIEAGETVYPMRAVPDGYSIYQEAIENFYPDDQGLTYGGVVFRSVYDPAFTAADTSHITMTCYDGTQYVRGWIAQKDFSALRLDRGATLYFDKSGPGVPDGSALTPITIPLFRVSHGELVPNFLYHQDGMAPPNQFVVPAGEDVVLDKHAQEDFEHLTLPEYHRPDWTKIPGVFNDGEGGDNDYRNPLNAENYSEFDGSSQLEPFSTLPENAIFHGGRIMLRNLQRLSYSTDRGEMTPTDELVDVRPLLNRPYTFIKHDDGAYLCGWVAERLTNAEAASHVLLIANAPDAPVFQRKSVPIQVRLNARSQTPNSEAAQAAFAVAGSANVVSASNVYLDKYAWKKW